jgi:hypothetical protein
MGDLEAAGKHGGERMLSNEGLRIVADLTLAVERAIAALPPKGSSTNSNSEKECGAVMAVYGLAVFHFGEDYEARERALELLRPPAPSTPLRNGRRGA